MFVRAKRSVGTTVGPRRGGGGGLNEAWTQFAINRNHQPRQKYISIDKAVFILVHPNLLGYVQFSHKQTVQEVSLYHKWLQRVHKPLQVITSTQTSPGYHEYTNHSRLYQSQSPPEIKTAHDWNKHSKKREQ